MVELGAKQAFFQLLIHALPCEQHLNALPEFPSLLLHAPDQRTWVEPRRLTALLRPSGNAVTDRAAVVPFFVRVDDDQRKAGRVLHRVAVLREIDDRNVCAAPKFILDQLADPRTYLRILVERGAPVADDLS